MAAAQILALQQTFAIDDIRVTQFYSYTSLAALGRRLNQLRKYKCSNWGSSHKQPLKCNAVACLRAQPVVELERVLLGETIDCLSTPYCGAKRFL